MSAPVCSRSAPAGWCSGGEGRCCCWSAGSWGAASNPTAASSGWKQENDGGEDPEWHNGWWWGSGGRRHGGPGPREIGAPGDPQWGRRCQTEGGYGWPLSLSWLLRRVDSRTWSQMKRDDGPGGRPLQDRETDRTERAGYSDEAAEEHTGLLMSYIQVFAINWNIIHLKKH